MQRRQPRPAFTITELLVAMALIIFIMYILAEAFGAGSTAFRNLKAIGDMNEKLRSAGGMLRRDLQADHFEDKRRVSDPDFWKEGPPRRGFLRIYNATALSTTAGAPYFKEGLDADNNPSARAVDHGLHFTVKLRGNNRGDYFRAGVPAGSPLLLLPLQDTRFQETTTQSVSSAWAEKAVFLKATGQMSEDEPNGAGPPQPLYALYVRTRLLVPDNQAVKTANGGAALSSTLYANYAEMSCHQDPTVVAPNPPVLFFNSPADVTMPARRLGNTAGLPAAVSGASPLVTPVYPTLGTETASLGAGGSLEGNDVVLTNVLSFEVKVLPNRQQWDAWVNANVAANPNFPVADRFYDFIPLSHGMIQSYATLGSSFPTTGTNGFVFDTWSQGKDEWQDYVGGASTTMNGNLNAGAGFNTVAIASPAGFPASGRYLIRIDSEEMLVTAGHGTNSWTVVRGVNGTSAVAHLGGAQVEMLPLWAQTDRQQGIPLYRNINTGQKLRLMALQITIRLWDGNTRQTRQSSVVVEL